MYIKLTYKGDIEKVFGVEIASIVIQEGRTRAADATPVPSATSAADITLKGRYGVSESVDGIHNKLNLRVLLVTQSVSVAQGWRADAQVPAVGEDGGPTHHSATSS